MITFESRQKVIRNADLITRRAHSLYPHVSESRIVSMIGEDKVKDLFWGNMSLRYALKFAAQRYNMEIDEKNLYRYVLESFQGGLGNCSEEAKLAELIARINGQKNVYSGKIFAGKGFAKHEVAFITDKEIKPDKKYHFKNKDALIIDPWLGVTDFAGRYFKSLTKQYAKVLQIRGNAKPSLQADFSSKLTPKKLGDLKKGHPELIIRNYRPISFKGHSDALRYAQRTKFINKIFNKKLCDLNFEKLEGIQQGLKTFEGLSLKQIAFALTDLHSINMISGCTNHCLHCYANAQPFIKRYPFEDLLQICNDVKELRNRLGVNPVHHHGQPYIDCSFDADALDCHLYDKEGQKHDFIEIAKIMKDALGYSPVFDTNGWGTGVNAGVNKGVNADKQAAAEEYVRKLMQDGNYKNFHQINISINPFRPKYVQAVNSEFNLDELYRPIRKVGSEYEQEEASLSEDYKKARDRYTQYVKDTANVLLTFKPVLDSKKLHVIIRVLDNSIEEMKGFRLNDFTPAIIHIMQELNLRAHFGMLTKKEFKQYVDILNNYSTRMFTSGRMEKFYKTKNPEKFSMINRIDKDREIAEQNYDRIKVYEKLSAANMRYLKMITPDGKVFLYDNYSIIPTDIQLKTSTPDIKKPFQIPVKDFIVTEKMIDLI